MKIYSWNVNGWRAIWKKDFCVFLRREKPDILCLQEIKISRKDIDLNDFSLAGYVPFWNPAERPGYSGTAFLMEKNLAGRIKNYLPGIDDDRFDREGRVQALEMEDFFLVNAYFPNANQELSRLPYKMEFNQCLLNYLKKIEKKKPVIIGGDFNVAHQEIDLARPKDNEGSAGFTQEEREWMSQFLQVGFVDTYRYFFPKKMVYSWWSYRARAREKNIGWRIDYFCVSAKIISQVKQAAILGQISGSDHCPIFLSTVLS